MNPFAVIARAFLLWWDELVIMLALNTIWLLLQVPLITGPPATAMVYALLDKSANGEYWGVRDGWEAFRRLFWPAWRWGALNLLLLGVAAFNFLAYRDAPGFGWQTLRVIWAITTATWLIMNLFYWPFWLAQADKSMRLTYFNCLKFLALNPLAAVVFALAVAGLLYVSLVTALPIAAGLMCWLGLIGVVAVRQAIARRK
jgi:hypothetical protein